MFTEDVKKQMEAVKESMRTVRSSQGFAIFDSSAVDKAKQKQHSNFKDGGGFEAGDIVTFPTSDELDSSIGSQGKSVFVLCAIQRGNKTLVLPVYSKWMHNDVHPCDSDAKTDDEHWHTHKGAPADDARTAGMSDYDVFAFFANKKVKITKVDKLQCRVIRRGAVADKDGHFAESDFIAGKRKFYTMEYVN